MSPFRYRDDDSSSTSTIVGALLGAVAGFALGMVVADRVGGFSGLRSKFRRRAEAAQPHLRAAHGVADDYDDEFEVIEEDELETEGAYDEGVEQRMLDAFRNDPSISDRAVKNSP